MLKEKYSLILMDINMPAMNGVEAFKEIKKDSPDTTVIMMTAYSMEDLIKDALKEGAYDVLRKPLDISKAIATIESAKKESALVMIIDDDINTREGLKDILIQKGFKVTMAKTGEEALEITKKTIIFPL